MGIGTLVRMRQEFLPYYGAADTEWWSREGEGSHEDREEKMLEEKGYWKYLEA